MADQAEVEAALVGLVCNALQSSEISYRAYRGWPDGGALDADLAKGIANITVFPAGEMRNTTRYADDWIADPPVTPGLTAVVDGELVTFSGSGSAGQVAGVLADECSYVYRLTDGDSAPLVAATIAAAIRADRIVQLAGSGFVVPGAGRLLARVAMDQTATREVRRQEQEFRVSFWCASPQMRDVVTRTVDGAFATIPFVALPDGSVGRLLFRQSITQDGAENANLYRRDLCYLVDYPTIETQTQPAMLFGDVQLGSNAIEIVARIG
jgi:hypothetical protein